MRKRLIVFVLSCGSLALTGQSIDSAKAERVAGAEGDPITDKVRLEIAKTQRDLLLASAKMRDAEDRYLAAKAEAEGLQKALAEKIAGAGRACGEKKIFDTVKLACTERVSPGKDK